MSDVHRDTHVGEVETVAQENQGQGDNMVKDQLFEIFPRLLQQEQQHYGERGRAFHGCRNE